MSSEPVSFDYLVIGAGSGGMASARRAAQRGAKVAVIEKTVLGGTCVNVGCVPKKVMWESAHNGEYIQLAKMNGWTGVDASQAKFDWKTFTAARNAYIKRLNGIYESNLKNDQVTLIRGDASFVNPKLVKVGETTYTGTHILVAVGGAPIVPDIPGKELVITSDGFFALTEQPKRVAIVGAGYIAVELGQVLHALGSHVELFIRGDTVLKNFDDLMSKTVMDQMKKSGITVHTQTAIKAVTEEKGGMSVECADGRKVSGFDTVIYAIGRAPGVSLNLSSLGAKLLRNGALWTDEYQNTTIENLHAVGDVIGKIDLTPVAIAAGRKLADRLFGGPEFRESRLEYEFVPSVVFSHPPIGTIGFSEREAMEKFDKVKVYSTKFNPMIYFNQPEELKSPCAMKVVCAGEDEKVVGMHLCGPSVDEMIQGFAVAIKMGCTKKQLDSCVAIHPTLSEELVLLK